MRPPLDAASAPHRDPPAAGRNAVALRLLATLRALLRGPATVEELAADAGTGRRMLYRYLHALEAAGVPIVRSPEDRVLYRVRWSDLRAWARRPRGAPPGETTTQPETEAKPGETLTRGLTRFQVVLAEMAALRRTP